MNNRICPHCKKDFDCNGRVFSNHVRWCSENPKRKEMDEQYVKKLSQRSNERLGEFRDFEVKCSKCGKIFTVNEREKLFPSKEHYFCSRSCANSRERPQVIKDKISKKMRIYYGTDGIEKKCVICGERIDKIGHVKTCSKECHDLLIKQNSKRKLAKIIESVANTEDEYKIKLRHYRNSCAFRFALSDYPDEFDFSLIEKYGWYSPTNKNNNLGGVSRDHMYSVKDGFENNVPPELLAHPANCRLLLHDDNISKNKNSCITIDELKQRILLWENKYNK